MRRTAARQGDPIGATEVGWSKMRSEEILRFSTISYDAGFDFRQVHQAIYKSSTFSKRWNPRKLGPSELEDLLTGVVPPSRNRGETRGSRTRALRAGAMKDVDAAKQADAEADPEDDKELSQILDRLLNLGGTADSNNSFKKEYFKMLLLKSESIELGEKKIRLKQRQDALQMSVSMVPKGQRMVKT